MTCIRLGFSWPAVPVTLTAAWPANLAPRADSAYHILVGDWPQRRITMRVLTSLPADDDVLTKLHELGCKQQFEAWVRERVATWR